MVKENEQNDRLPSGKSEGNDRKVKRNLLKKSWIKKKNKKKTCFCLCLKWYSNLCLGLCLGLCVLAGWVAVCANSRL